MKKQNLIIIFLAIVVLAGCKSKIPASAYQKTSAPPKNEVAETVTKPLPKIEVVEVTEEIAPVEEVKVKHRSEVFTVVAGEDENSIKEYSVIIGSFSKQDNAKGLQAKMRPIYSPTIIKNEQGMYRVVIQSFNEYENARHFIMGIRNQFFDAWILIQQK